jgi:hypothetical protein
MIPADLRVGVTPLPGVEGVSEIMLSLRLGPVGVSRSRSLSRSVTADGGGGCKLAGIWANLFLSALFADSDSQ